MEWQQIEHFVVVAKLQHMTRAAERLSLSQPALSRSIAKLEAELGVPLLDREGRTVRLNRYGEQFLLRAERVLEEMRLAREDIASLLDPDHGMVALSFLKSLGAVVMPKLLGEFLKQHPAVRFQLHQQSTRVMLGQLERGEVDLVLSSMTETAESIEWVYLWEEEMFAYVPAEHPLAGRSAVSLEELAAYPFITVKQGYGLRDVTDRLFAQAGLQPAIALEGEDTLTVVGFVASGLGVSLLPLVPALPAAGAVCLRLAPDGCSRSIGLARRKGAFLSPAAQKFEQFLYSRYVGG